MKLTLRTLLYFFIVFLLPACTFAQQDAQQDTKQDNQKESTAQATQTWQLDYSAQWLSSIDSKLYSIDKLGSITELDVDSGTVQTVATAHERSFLTSCNNTLVYVDTNSRLNALNGFNSSIEVAPFSMPTCLESDNLKAGHLKTGHLKSGYIVVVNTTGDLILVDDQGEGVSRLQLDALRDAQLRQADVDRDGSNEIIVLTQPTERYGHGVLGDRTEAESITVVDSKSWTVKASFELPEPFVFEQLRAEALDTGTKTLILGTRASRQTGAGVIALELQDNELVQVGEAGVIGLGNRWLNLFDVANGEAYAIKTPHIGGPLQRYSFVEDELQLRSQTVGVTNHRIGDRNLDLAVLIENSDNTTLFVAPQYDQKTLEAFSCVRGEMCESQWTYKMDNFLTSNILVQEVGDTVYVAAADQGGKLYLIDINWHLH